jgi:hypothetical protein
MTDIAAAFAKHGIDHLSPSSLNMWAAEPALWLLERRLGHRSATSPIMVRGRAVEHGVHHGLTKPAADIAEAQAVALAEFDRETALEPDPRREHERSQVAGYVAAALAELRQYGVPTGYQERVEIRLDEVPVPVIGFLDWRFDQHGLIVDLKTAERLPSAISDTHGRQGAVYAHALGNHAMRFAYAKPMPGKKDGRAVNVFELDRQEVVRHLAALREIALRLGRFLALSSDPRELSGLLVPNYDAFFWSSPGTRAAGAAAYGF